MIDMAICLEVQLNKPLVLEGIAPKEDTSTKKGDKCKLLLDLVETSKESLEEKEESTKDLLTWMKYQS